MRRSSGMDPAGDITTSANLGDVHTPDPARAGHEALGCWRYPHEGPCGHVAKKRKVKK